MYRSLLPRIYEIKDLCTNDTEHSYFNRLDNIITNSSLAKDFYKCLDDELFQLDHNSWDFFKSDIISEIATYDKNRGWFQLFNRLNEVKGFIYLKNIGCSNVKFIERSREKTPDLKGKLDEENIYCEVKTINISESEIEKRKKPKLRRCSYDLPDEFFNKLSKVIQSAELQFFEKSEKNIIYIIINFDEISFDPQEKFFEDIECFLKKVDVISKVIIYNPF